MSKIVTHEGFPAFLKVIPTLGDSKSLQMYWLQRGDRTEFQTKVPGRPEFAPVSGVIADMRYVEPKGSPITKMWYLNTPRGMVPVDDAHILAIRPLDQRRI